MQTIESHHFEEDDEIENLEATKRLVIEELSTREETRNSDKRLIESVWSRQGFNIRIPDKVSSTETIRRIRQQIQHDGEYLPTNAEVAYKRKIKEKVWREYFANNIITLNKFINFYYGVK